MKDYLIGAGLFLVVALGVVTVLQVVKFATTPMSIINKTLDADNILNTYEQFHDIQKAYVSRIKQINSHKLAMASLQTAGMATKDSLEKFTIEIEGMKQSCRDLVAKYNANSVKTNRSIFKGGTLPEMLSLDACD